MTLVPLAPTTVTAVVIWLELALVLALPFHFAGVVVTLVLTRSRMPVGRTYAADMQGAALGCLCVLILLRKTDAPSAIIWVAMVGALAAWMFARSGIGTTHEPKAPLHWMLTRRKTLIAVLAFAALANGAFERSLQPLSANSQLEKPGVHLYREWNSFSRIAVYEDRYIAPFLWGGSPTMPTEWRVNQRFLNIDGFAGTPAYQFYGDLSSVEFLRYDVTNLAYFLPRRDRVAVIGIGGGRDLLAAAHFGRRDVTGIELNPIFVKLLSSEPVIGGFSQIARLPGIKLVVDEGRSWMARGDEDFDLIQMSLIDTWAATNAGAFTLSENGLYTPEAWKSFLERLSGNGVFTVSRWYSPDSINETGRMVSLASAALIDLEVDDPRGHLFLAGQGSIATLLVSRSRFTAEDIAVLEETAALYQHQIIFSPNVMPASGILTNIVAASNDRELQAATRGLALNLSPPTDDRPFFFNQLPLMRPVQAFTMGRQMFDNERVDGGVVHGNLLATVTLITLFLISALLVALTIVIPLKPALKDVGPKVVVGGTLYFLLIGAGS